MLSHAMPCYAQQQPSAASRHNEGCVHDFAEGHAWDSRHLDFEEQEYWEGSGEELEMQGDDEEADMRTQEELMMQHRYMMVSHPPPSTSLPLALPRLSFSLIHIVSIVSELH